MSVKGQWARIKCSHSPLNLRILSSTSVPFTLTTVQVPNLSLTHTMRITVHLARSHPPSRLDLLFIKLLYYLPSMTEMQPIIRIRSLCRRSAESVVPVDQAYSASVLFVLVTGSRSSVQSWTNNYKDTKP